MYKYGSELLAVMTIELIITAQSTVNIAIQI